MTKRRWLPALIAGAVLWLSVQPAWAQRGRREEEETSRKPLPILQYTVAVVCGSLALWSVLRSSRRGWS